MASRGVVAKAAAPPPPVSFAAKQQALAAAREATFQAAVQSMQEQLHLFGEQKLIQERNTAKKARNFGRSDQIRQELMDSGVVLEDTKEGTRWKRK